MKIPIVDEQDRIINETIGMDIDDDIDGIYRVAGVWAISVTGEVLLSRRSLAKPRSPGLWGPAVLGLVEGEETYISTVKRRALEMLGVEFSELIEIPKIFIQTTRKYFVQFFVSILPHNFTAFRLLPEEVAEVKWFAKGELESMFNESPESFIPLFRETYDMLKVY